MDRWFDRYDNVLALGQHMVENGYCAEDLQHYHEKPWKFDDEWQAYYTECKDGTHNFEERRTDSYH